MKDYVAKNIRNVCLLSHGGAGKTEFAEAMLYNAGLLDRIGKVLDGNTSSDYDPEEIKRKISINLTLEPFEWLDHKINIIDTPGYFDFVGEVMSGIRVADSAIIIVSGKSGVAVGTEKTWKYAKERDIPRILFINKMEDENADFYKVLDELKQKFGKGVAPFQIPIKKDGKLIGVVDVIHRKGNHFTKEGVKPIDIPPDIEARLDEYWEMIMEAIAETSEEMMEKFFAGEAFTEEEIAEGIRVGTKEGYLIPVFGGSAVQDFGVIEAMNAIVSYMPSPVRRGAETVTKQDGNDSIEINPVNTEPAAALVFKTLVDPFIGKISFLRVYSGTLKSDMSLANTTADKIEKLGPLFSLRGKKQVPMKEAIAGDIVCAAKLANTATNDTLCDPARPVIINGCNFPAPMLSLAVLPKNKGDEEKISAGLHKLMDEDKTLNLYTNHETHQMVMQGIGEQHLDVVVSKLKSRYNVDVQLIDVRVPYRETIRKKVDAEGKHKKQSGGHGQYGHVKITFEPGPAEELTFRETIFGGSVPKSYHPAVEKGLQDSIEKGVLAGYPVVNLQATLTDGSYHDVDSSEMAFKLAARLAYKKGLPEASPVLLEPISSVEVFVPDEYMGDVIGDLNKRRGRVLGMDPMDDGSQKVTAEVPMSEMFKYATDLRSITQGRGDFVFEFARYEQAPQPVADKVIESAQKDMVDEGNE